MSGKFVLDTNIVIALFAQNEQVIEKLKTADEVFIPCIVLGELYYGANKSSRLDENITRIDEFSAANQILAIDGETAHYYGDIKNDLRAKGKPIPENDICIAALVRQHESMLVTQDKHFSEIESLQTTSW